MRQGEVAHPQSLPGFRMLGIQLRQVTEVCSGFSSSAETQQCVASFEQRHLIVRFPFENARERIQRFGRLPEFEMCESQEQPGGCRSGLQLYDRSKAIDGLLVTSRGVKRQP